MPNSVGIEYILHLIVKCDSDYMDGGDWKRKKAQKLFHAAFNQYRSSTDAIEIDERKTKSIVWIDNFILFSIFLNETKIRRKSCLCM